MAKPKMTLEQHEMLEHLEKLENEAQAANHKVLQAIDAELAPKLKEVTRKFTDRIGVASKAKRDAITALRHQYENDVRNLRVAFEKQLAEAQAAVRPELYLIEAEMQSELQGLNDVAAGKRAKQTEEFEGVLAECKTKREAVLLVAKHDAPPEPKKPAEKPAAQPETPPTTQPTP